MLSRVHFPSSIATPAAEPVWPARIIGALSKLRSPGKFWNSLSLSVQFLVAASLVLFTAMAALGTWVSSRIENRVVNNTAITTAFYMSSLIEPAVQSLAKAKDFDAAARAELDQIMLKTPIGKTLATVKIWNLDGTIVYCTNPDQVGKSFPETAGFKKARQDLVEAEFNDLSDEENIPERRFNRPLLEVYYPLHEYGTNRVIGVAEMYQFGDDLQADVTKTRWHTFVGVGVSSLGMLGMLFTIVRRGNRTIEKQRVSLENQIDHLSRLLNQNEELRRTLITARKSTTQTNERLLRRTGAELHDGPAQLMGLALLYYDGLKPGHSAPPAQLVKFESVRGLLQDSLGEIRNISAGIAPPQLEKMTPLQTLELAIRNHEKRAGVAVDCKLGELPADLPLLLKTCLYRFVQEGLNNAFRHAKSAGSIVQAKLENGILIVEVSNNGPGFALTNLDTRLNHGLGLAGLIDRVETCDGTVVIASSPGHGTRLTAKFDLKYICENERGTKS